MPWANNGGQAWNGTRCSPVADDPDQPGESCMVEGSAASGVDSCDVGAICWDVDTETNEGVCTPQCTGSENAPTCSDPSRICSFGADAILTLCLPRCHPLDPETCPQGAGCYPIDNGMVCVSDRSDRGSGPFQECIFLNACESGTVCTDPSLSDACGPDAGGCCLPWCDVDAPDCPAGMVCDNWFSAGDTPPDLEDVGICVDADA